MSKEKEEAVRLFKSGYNCSQAILGAYCEAFGMDKEMALKLSCPFGGGMGRMRLTCGAFSGMAMVSGLYNGMADASAEGKKASYELLNVLAEEFKKINCGTLNCTVGIQKKADGSIETKPEERTKEYYKKRPCLEIIEGTADIIDKYIMSEE